MCSCRQVIREISQCFWAGPCHPTSQRRLQCLCWNRTLAFTKLHLRGLCGSCRQHCCPLSLNQSYLPQIPPSTHPTKNESHYFQFQSLHLPHRDNQSWAGVSSDGSNQHQTPRLLLLGQSSCSNSIPSGTAGNRVNIYPVRKGAAEDRTIFFTT